MNCTESETATIQVVVRQIHPHFTLPAKQSQFIYLLIGDQHNQLLMAKSMRYVPL